MSISESSSKIHEPKTYEEAVSDPIHGRQWRDAVEEELHNLESHHTWEFEELPSGRKPSPQVARYLACGSRPDIAFVVGRLSKHNADLRKGHLRAAKRVVRYLKGTIHLELVYGQNPDGSYPTTPAPYGLIGYGDSNFAGDLEDRKSVMGYCFFLNGAVVSRSSKKQKTVSTSTVKR